MQLIVPSQHNICFVAVSELAVALTFRKMRGKLEAERNTDRSAVWLPAQV